MIAPTYPGLARARPRHGAACCLPGPGLARTTRRPVTAEEIEPDPLPDQEALPLVFDDEAPART